MNAEKASALCPDARRSRFGETHWTVVLAAQDGGDAPARLALDTLCRLYWYQRGGDCTFWSLDALAAEQRYAGEPVDGNPPDVLYDRRWALRLLEHSLRHLRQEHIAAGNGEVFERM
jgi:hypothetical protein